MGVSRNTVRKYIEEGEPRARPRKPRVAPVREVAEPEARKILEEWKNRTTAKQRITASRLHEELRKGGIEGNCSAPGLAGVRNHTPQGIDGGARS